MKKFEWNKIKGGFVGFEELANDYVNDQFKVDGYYWNKTKQTRDGNKDSFIIIGFQPNNLSCEEWWMEAKYSDKFKFLTRYRLDSTIVSAAIHGNVSKIIFVTNIEIASKTISDIKIALSKNTNCKEVHFCTKNTLEFWLSNNEQILLKYFGEKVESITLTEDFVIEETTFYSVLGRIQPFSDSLKTIRIGEMYYAYFSLFSAKKQHVEIQIISSGLKANIIENKTILLKKGVNACSIKFMVLEKMKTYNTTVDKHPFTIKIGKVHIQNKYLIEILPKNEIKLNIVSQQKNLQMLTDNFKIFKNEKISQVNLLTGESGIGKTFTIEGFIERNYLYQNEVYHISFSNNMLENDIELYNMLCFIFFPYLPPNEIDTKYLNRLMTDTDIYDDLFELAKYKENPDALHSLLQKYNFNKNFFKNKLSINERIIILDDIHKLNNTSLTFLLSIITELYTNKTNSPVYIILSGWPELYRLDSICEIRRLIKVFEIKGIVTSDDIEHVFSEIFEFEAPSTLYTNIFTNIIELIQFLKYLNGNRFKSLDDFIKASAIFLNTDIYALSIISPINKLIDNNKIMKSICDEIFLSINGRKIFDNLLSEEKKLLHNNLVKYSHNKKYIIPYHDRYRDIYKTYYKKDFVVSNDFDINDIPLHDKVQINLINSNNSKELKNAIKIIRNWLKEGKFYSLNYVLEPIFNSQEKNVLRHKLESDYDYFLLYQAYAFAITNSSSSLSGREIFEDIVCLTYKSSDIKSKHIYLRALFETINSCYERLEFSLAHKKISEFNKMMKILQNFKALDIDDYKTIEFVLTQTIIVLISAECSFSKQHNEYDKLYQTLLEYNYNYEANLLKLRYAETMFRSDPRAAMIFIDECKESFLQISGSTEKFYLWSCMDYAILKMILTGDIATNMPLVLDAHSKMRGDFYNDYRKRSFIIANLYYMYDLVELGDKYFITDSVIARGYRKRQEAWYHQTLSLRQAVTGDVDLAILSLKRAAEAFRNISSYNDIVNHNIEVLSNNQFAKNKIAFATHKDLIDNIYYIDPRCIR